MEENRTLVRFIDQEIGQVFTEGLMTEEQMRLLNWLSEKDIICEDVTFSIQESVPEIV